MLMFSFKVEKSQKEARLDSLRGIFERIKNQELLVELSDRLKGWSSFSQALSVEHHKLQSNVSFFVEGLTGEKELTYQKAIRILRDISVNKTEQSKVLYEAIEKQQTQIALQQQIITCLEYRHAIEELPNMTSSLQNPPRPTDGHSGAWKKTWRLAVECELDVMIRIYINPPPTEPATVASPGTNEDASSEHTAPANKDASSGNTNRVVPPAARLFLRQLLQYDFDKWAKNSAPLKEAKRTVKVPESHKKKKVKGKEQNLSQASAVDVVEEGDMDWLQGQDTEDAKTITDTTNPTGFGELGDVNTVADEDEDEGSNVTEPAEPVYHAHIKGNAETQGVTVEAEVIEEAESAEPAVNAETTKTTEPAKYAEPRQPAEATTVTGSKRNKESQRKPYQTTGNYFLVTHFNPDYETWPSFQRGDALYHDLSRNIHGYNKSYETHEINFSNSDLLLFSWLRPDPEDFDNETKEVMWNKVWEKRGLGS